MARLEYLYTDYALRSVDFSAGAQRFASDLAVQTVRVGLDYRLGSDGMRPGDLHQGTVGARPDNFVVHGQTTFVEQYAPPFHAPYRRPNSLDPNAGRETWDVTLYAGLRLWQGAELWINPEIDQGFGLSGTLGVAGFPSGEAYKVGSLGPLCAAAAHVHPADHRPRRRDREGRRRRSTSSAARRPPTGW